METLVKKSQKNGLKRTLRFCTLLFSFVVFFAISAVANDISAKNATPPTEEEEAASLENKRKEAIRQTYLSYVYIASAVVFVIALALFTSRSKKKGKGNSNTAEHPHHTIKSQQHSSHDQKYGASRHR